MKQIALYQKYPDPLDFCRDYNPDLQKKLICNGITNVDIANNSNIPTLGLLCATFGITTPKEWLKIQIGSLNDYAEQKMGITGEALDEACDLIIAEYYYLNAAEICLFIAKFKLCKYGEFYGAIGAMKILGALLKFVKERRLDIERNDREQENINKIAERDKYSKCSISHGEYLKLKERALNGDKEAINLLKKPNLK